jgi:hypothetical protein
MSLYNMINGFNALMTIKRYDNFKRTFDPLPEPYREEDTNVNVKS